MTGAGALVTLRDLPRLSLARLPTPLEDAPRLAAALGLRRLLVKRDDLTDLALGGNKVRKLELLLGDARVRGADTIVATASAQSNFLRLAAAAARRVGMRSIFVVRGDPDAPLQGNLLLMRLFGADLRFVDTDDPYDQATVALMDETVEEARRVGARPYKIHLGMPSAGGTLATAAYVQAAEELVAQLDQQSTTLDHVVLAVGSGGTYSGVLLGLRLHGVAAHVLGVSVNTPAAKLRDLIEEKMQAVAALLVGPPGVPHDAIDIIDTHVGPGYGLPSTEGLHAVRLAAETEGLLLDPVYTGKALAALRQAVAAGTIDRESTVCFVHTGGAPSVFAHAEAFGLPAGADATATSA